MKRWIADLATTNFRIVISIGTSGAPGVVLLTGIMLKIELQSEIVWALLAFVGAMLGIDVTQFSIKRKTELVTPPTVTAEHAVVAAPVPQPVGKPHPATPPEIVDAIGGGVEGALRKKEDLSGD
jgi:hypothetical protein